MVLPSNVNAEEFPDNTTSHFITPFAKPLELDKDNWSVALTEISYPHTWYNVNSDINKITLFNLENGATIQRRVYRFEPGYYTGAQLAKVITECMNSLNFRSTIKYKLESNKMMLSLEINEGIMFQKDLAVMMGWHNKTRFIYDEEAYGATVITHSVEGGEVSEEYSALEFKAPNCLDLNFSSHYMYIYCNLVKEVMVGNSFLKLLKTVSTHISDQGQYVTRIFTSPLYVPLASSFENYVEIAIRNDEGEPFMFESGKAIVTLHFKRNRHTLF